MSAEVKLPSREVAVLAALSAIDALPATARAIKASVWEFVPEVGGGWAWTVEFSTTIGSYSSTTPDERPTAKERALRLMTDSPGPSGRVHATTIPT